MQGVQFTDAGSLFRTDNTCSCFLWISILDTSSLLRTGFHRMMGPPNSLARDISPPPSRPFRKSSGTTPGTHGQAVASVQDANNPDASEAKPSSAAIEAGETEIRDHLEYFSKHLQEVSKHTPPSILRITIDGFQDLYKRNQHSRGRHFVIHQHDHPISGSFDRP